MSMNNNDNLPQDKLHCKLKDDVKHIHSHIYELLLYKFVGKSKVQEPVVLWTCRRRLASKRDPISYTVAENLQGQFTNNRGQDKRKSKV
jgi:hypothetical protein